jgi:hemerythrin
MIIEWREELALGVPEIDDQHRELFRRFNLLLAACSSGKGNSEVCGLINFLCLYVIQHFNEEEKLQQESGYPGYEEHREMHRSFVDRLGDLREQMAREGASLSLVLTTNNVLIDWLIRHITREDRKIGEHLRAQAVPANGGGHDNKQ